MKSLLKYAVIVVIGLFFISTEAKSQNLFNPSIGIQTTYLISGDWTTVQHKFLNESGILKFQFGICGDCDQPSSFSTYLATNGSTLWFYKPIKATDIVIETPNSNWPDYVFSKNYKIKPLTEVEKFIFENKHLPEVPSAADVKKNGINVAEINTLLLKKVEELTVYIIEQDKRIKALEQAKN